MLKRRCMAGCIILFLCLGFVAPIELKAEKSDFHYKETKIDKRILKNNLFTRVSISKGKYYSLKRFVSILKNSNNSKHYDVSYVSSDMKEDKKAILSGKGLTIRKQSFKAVKTGTFRLKVKVNGNSYIFPLWVVEPYYKMDFQNVGKISLKKYVMWESTMAFIEDTDVINKIMHEINRARYSFDVECSLRSNVECDDYFVSLYSKDGRILESIMLCPHKIVRSRSTWTADISAAKECFDYISAVYNDAWNIQLEWQAGKR